MPLDEVSEETWSEVMRTNLDSVFLVSQAVVRHMIPRRRGVIINICSVQSELGRPGIAPYTAAKGGVKMLTKGMAIDWGKHGIRVNGLGPGYFKTEMNAALVANESFSGWLTGRTPLGRWGRGRRAGRSRGVPRVQSLELCHRARALCGRRRDRSAVAAPRVF